MNNKSFPFFSKRGPGSRARYAGTGKIAAAALALLISPLYADTGSEVSDKVRSALAQIMATDAHYRAVIAIDPEALAIAKRLDRQRKARGPLHGELLLLKDNIESMGLPTTAGSLALANNDTGKDAPLVAQLRQAGAVILGKANLSEWANFRSEHSLSGWSGVGGQTRNAYDRTRSPCGSSSGSAVAVALGYTRVTIGTETSGSIVCPAAVNGVVGFKPTLGLVSGEGIVPLASSQDTAGPIASSVEVAALTLAVISNPEREQTAAISAGLRALKLPEGLAGLRIGVVASTQGFDTRRDTQLQQVLDTLSESGATVVPGLKIKPYDDFGRESYDVLLYEFRRDLNRYLSSLSGPLRTMDLNSLIRFNEAHKDRELALFDQSIFLRAAAINDSELTYLQKHRRTRRAMREEGLDTLFEGHRLDALVGVTLGPAWTIDEVNGDAVSGPGMARPAAIAGNPHITLPLGEVAGLPLGISLVGKRWEDHKLAAIARELERLHPKPNYRHSEVE